MIFRSIRDQEPRSLFLESFKGLNPDLSLNISTKWNEDGTFNNELLEYENLKIETEKFYRIMGDITTVQTKISERIKFIRKDPTKPLSGADLPYLIASTVEPTISIIALSILPSLILWWWPLVPLAGLSTVTAGSSIRALDITLKVKKQHNAGVSEGNLQKPLETINEINEGKIPSVEALRTAASELINKINSIDGENPKEWRIMDHALWTEMKKLRFLLKELLKNIKSLELKETDMDIPYFDPETGQSKALQYPLAISMLNQLIIGSKKTSVEGSNLGEIVEFLVKQGNGKD